MTSRQTARRLLVAAPALALTALAAGACHPPNEKPSDSDASYTLPSYSEEAKPSSSKPAAPEHTGASTAATTTRAPEAGMQGQAPAQGQAPGQAPAQAPAGGAMAPAGGA